MRNGRSSIVEFIAALALLSPAAAGAADTAGARVYLLCSARVPVAAQSSGKVYRSAIFSVPADGADNAGAAATMASKAFQTYLTRTYGLRGPLPASCDQAPDNAQGKNRLQSLRQKPAAGDPASIEIVATDFIPPQFQPSGKELQFEAEQQQYEARRQQYERDLAAHRAGEQKLAQQQKVEAASVQQAARAKAEYAAQLKKFNAAQAEYQRQRAIYEHEYQKATGTQPPR
jgi:hypothetical protein